MHEGVGTLYSMSPQVLQGVYTSQADLWSCGVITYMLLSSHRPFYHKRRKVMIDRIMRADYTFEKDYWKPISDEAKEYISKLLVMDPKERMNAGEALEHIWLSKEFPLSDRVPDQSTADAVQENLIHYKDTSQLKKIALNVGRDIFILLLPLKFSYVLLFLWSSHFFLYRSLLTSQAQKKSWSFAKCLINLTRLTTE